jgi:hypothetical protein
MAAAAPEFRAGEALRKLDGLGAGSLVIVDMARHLPGNQWRFQGRQVVIVGRRIPDPCGCFVGLLPDCHALEITALLFDLLPVVGRKSSGTADPFTNHNPR